MWFLDQIHAKGQAINNCQNTRKNKISLALYICNITIYVFFLQFQLEKNDK